MTVTKKADKLPDLEASLAEITRLVDTMEHDNLSLEQSLTQFERGITLVKHCQKILEDAEQRVKILIQNNNKEHLAAYGDDEGDDSDANPNEP